MPSSATGLAVIHWSPSKELEVLFGCAAGSLFLRLQVHRAIDDVRSTACHCRRLNPKP